MQISGHFIKFIYKGSNGYTVAVFELDDRNDEDITVVGYLPEMDQDTTYNLYGEYVEHRKYGMQFNIEQFEKVQINDERNIVRYLSGSDFKGIGPKFAKVIFDTLGPDVINIVKANPDELDAVPNMTKKKKQAIIDGLSLDTEDKYFYLTSNHLSMKNIIKLETKYNDDLLDVLNDNPYRVISEVDGIGFATMDKFGLSIGFTLDHPYRVEALTESLILDWCVQSGDSYLECEPTIDRLLASIPSNIDLAEILKSLVDKRRIAIEEDRIYHITQFTAENYIAHFLATFPRNHFIVTDKNEILEGISKIEQEIGIEYQDKQKEAIESFFENDLMILTGGPGTGKTTLVRGIVKLCSLLYPEYSITLCAPTGRASKRLAELTECESKTIHSLLSWDKESGRFAKDKENPLLTDLLIVDEFSMVDQWLFYSLLQACGNVRKIILIGDQDQLPSVGIGSVLKDLIDCEKFKIVKLERIYRQKEGSDIIKLAYDIKHNECDDIDTSHDIRFFECDSSQVKTITSQVVKYALDIYPDTYEGFMNVQVLAPKYKGANGIDALNAMLQKEFNPPSTTKRELSVGYRIFREGDKILQLKNQPDDDVFNGDIGILIEIIYAKEDINHQNRLIVDFDGVIVEYTPDMFVDITHAYCISIHKAQGSEYPIVVMPVVREYGFMLQKKLLYTAVTRSNTNLIMVGDKEVFLNAIKKEDYHVRKTTLKERLIKLL